MPQFKSGRCSLLAALVLAGPALGGCSSPSLPSLPSWFGSGPAAADSNASGVFTPPVNFECPNVEIRQGAGQLSISANPAEPTAMNQRYQLAFGELARECKVAGPMLTMKIGVRGRVILGPAGGPGEVDVPLRFAVVREGVNPTTITTKFHRLPVTIAPGDPHVAFSHVEDDITFPFPRGGEIDSYVVYIGFDPATAQEMDRKKKPAPKPARPVRRNTAQAPAQ
jgi:hypothetical protein